MGDGLMIDSKLPKVEKKAYTKPTLTEVRLVPQEAVLGGCKFGPENAAALCLTCNFSEGS
jgi:hypothetical protein